MNGPSPDDLYPVPYSKQIVHLMPLSKGKRNVKVGPYTYYDDDDNPEGFFEKNVRYHFEFIGDRLVIGPFCAIAKGATFIMNGANHPLTGFSTYPFAIFKNGWEKDYDLENFATGLRGNTKVGADVWIGNNATILPGVKIGSGSIIAANTVVRKNVKPYTIVAGNPSQTVKKRFDDETIKTLMEIAWWDWPIEIITQNLSIIRAGNLSALQKV